MSDKDILFKAVESNNISETGEILKHCAHDILEFRGGEVSICNIMFLQVFIRSYYCNFSRKTKSKLCSEPINVVTIIKTV